MSDIKDGFLKMILYCNLSEVYIDMLKYNAFPVLKLTSNIVKGKIKNTDNINEIEKFFELNKLSKFQIQTIELIFNEANENNFIVEIEQGT